MGSNGIVVSGGNTSVPYVNSTSYGNNNNPMQGMMRVSGTDMQVFDGSSWLNMSASYATVELTPEIQTLLDWARKKKVEEEILISLPSDNPAVKLARENINRIKQELARAEEQLKITEILSQDE